MKILGLYLLLLFIIKYLFGYVWAFSEHYVFEDRIHVTVAALTKMSSG